jgi:asparagine synthase (glutamine-hydrolysing)
MPNEDGTLFVIVNGEIYNFQELRIELEGRHVFRSRSDCEVILHLYEEVGDDCVDALDGMFAFALWDTRRGRVLLARDRLGKKPLYYREQDGKIAFASEIAAVNGGLGARPTFATELLPEFLIFGFVGTPRTLLEGVQRLPPATRMCIDAGGARAPVRYWRLPEEPLRPLPFADACSEVRRNLEAAVRKRLVADVPVGAMLSGGLDSSVVVALAARHSEQPLRTFSLGFEGPPECSELDHARTVAEALGTQHKELLLGPPPTDVVDAVLGHYGEPFGDATAIPLYLLARLVREDCPVALTGDGGDETFGGYVRFSRALGRPVRPPLRPLVLALASHLPGRIGRILRRPVRSAAEVFLASSAVFDVDFLPDLLAKGITFDPESAIAEYESRLCRHAEAGPLRSLIALNIETYLADDLLPKTDLMTMAHGVEARCPLLDRVLVERTFTLPDEYKVQGTKQKHMLRAIAGELLPASISRRPKQGFSAPLGVWFRGRWRSLAEESLFDSCVLSSLVKPHAVAGLWRRHLNGEDWGLQLWALVSLERWLRRTRP